MRNIIVIILLPIVALLEANPALSQGYTVQGTATWHTPHRNNILIVGTHGIDR
jgi:hypothetical protein